MPPQLPLLLLFLLSISPAISQPPDSSTIASCPRPTPCGSVDISYPFWVLSDNSSYSSSFCGYPGFDLFCVNATPVLQFPIQKHNYTVLHINTSNRSFTLRDAEVPSNGCPKPTRSFPFLEAPSRLRLSSMDTNLTFSFNCTGLRGNQSVPCLGNYSTVSRSEAVVVGSCKETVVVPVLKEALDAERDALGEKELRRVLMKGFRMEWLPLDADCKDCEISGGMCRFWRRDDKVMSWKCICSDGPHDGNCHDRGRGLNMKKKVIIVVCGSILGAIVATVIATLFVRRPQKSEQRNTSPHQASLEDFLVAQGPLGVTRCSYRELKKMTNNFSTRLGSGGYGSVYKGDFHNGGKNSIPVAVKLLSESKGSSGQDFINEVASIGRTNHVNVVSLLGFCLDGSRRALIYEFMPNGSLDRFIFCNDNDLNGAAGTPLGWEQLYRIALGIAKGLEYLHKRCRNRVVHFDIKPHNIPLDEDFCPKISDFGLAKLCPDQGSVLSMECARGTIGYIAPELVSRSLGPVSSKSDVYSYGMMMLEMVGGRRNFDSRVEKSSEMYFPHWAYKHLVEENDLRACGVTAESNRVATKMVIVGLWCIQTNPSHRPSINRVVEMLEGEVEDLEIPPKPYLSSSA